LAASAGNQQPNFSVSVAGAATDRRSATAGWASNRRHLIIQPISGGVPALVVNKGSRPRSAWSGFGTFRLFRSGFAFHESSQPFVIAYLLRFLPGRQSDVNSVITATKTANYQRPDRNIADAEEPVADRGSTYHAAKPPTRRGTLTGSGIPVRSRDDLRERASASSSDARGPKALLPTRAITQFCEFVKN
jgi:hypothetical protein